MYKEGIKNMSMICYYLQADDGMLQNLISGEEIPPADAGKSLSIDQAWHTIHYTLTGKVWDVSEDNILSQLVLGGEPINDEDMGYGPMRLLSKEIVSQLADALDEWDENSFRAKFKMEDLIANDVYPSMGMEAEEEFFQYVWESLNALKKFIKEAAAEKQNVLTFLA